MYRFGVNPVINKRYTWRPEYRLPFESQWSCVKKFSFLNAETPTASKRFIAQTYRCRKDDPIIRLVTESRFTMQKIRYCKKCLEDYGYHSVLHQSMFFDTCFLHGTPLIQTNIDIHDLHTETGFEDQYDVEKIVSAYKSADVIFESVKATPSAVSIDLVDLNLYRSGNIRPTNALKEYVLQQLSHVSHNRDQQGKLGRTVLSMQKSELYNESEKAVQELKNYIVNYDDGIESDIKEKHLQDLLLQDRWRTDGLCPLYLRAVAYRLVDNGIEVFFNQSNAVLCGICDATALSSDQVVFYGKILLLFWIFGTLTPSRMLKVWDCFQPDRYIANNLSLERLSKWYQVGYELLLFKLLDDMLDRGSQNLAAECQKGRVDFKDLKAVREFQLPDVFPQYLIVEDYCNVQLLAFE